MPPTPDGLIKPVVDLAPAIIDVRGEIQTLADLPMRSAQMILSRKGAVRGNHYHRTDWHYCYMLSGSMEYVWRKAGDRGEPRLLVVRAGQMIYTPALVEHAMRFLEDTKWITLAGNPRDQASYEADTVRIPLVP